MPQTRASEKERKTCSTYAIFHHGIWHLNTSLGFSRICASSFLHRLADILWHLLKKYVRPGRKQSTPFGTARRHHFLKQDYRYAQCGLSMWCSSLAGSHRESSQMSSDFGKCMVLAAVSAHATSGPSSANSFATLVAHFSVLTFHVSRVNLARLWLRTVRCSPRQRDNGSACVYFASHVVIFGRKNN